MLFPYITLSHPLCFFKQNFLSLCLFTLALSHTLFLSLYRRAISCAVASSSNGLPFKMHVYWQCLLSLPLNSTSLSLSTSRPHHLTPPFRIFVSVLFIFVNIRIQTEFIFACYMQLSTCFVVVFFCLFVLFSVPRL